MGATQQAVTLEHLQISPHGLRCDLEFVGDLGDGDVARAPGLGQDQPATLGTLLCVHVPTSSSLGGGAGSWVWG